MKSGFAKLHRIGAFGGLCALTALFVGCGDEVTKNNTTNVTGAKSVADLSQAGACGAETVGELVLNGEDDALYVCNGKNWVSLNGEAEEPAGGCSLNSIEVDGVEGVEIDCGNAKDTVLNGTPGAPGASGAAGQSCVGNKIAQGLQIVCGGVVLDTLTDGEDGADGAPGAPGAAGQSCTGRTIAEGLEISCGGVVLDTLMNGEDGADGATGAAGQSCTGTKISGGVVIRCGGIVVDTLRNGESGETVGFCAPTLGTYSGASPAAYDATERFCDTRDGKTYKYAKIGTQIWMAENLNFSRQPGNSIPYHGTFCYNDDTTYCEFNDWGRLYTWAAAMDSTGSASGGSANGCGNGKTCTISGRMRGVCPQGWHLPDSSEWATLFAYAGGGTTAATKLKSQNARWTSLGGTTGTNELKFAASPFGRRLSDGTYGNPAEADYWMSEQTGKYYARLAKIDNSVSSAIEVSKALAYPVRCVKN